MSLDPYIEDVKKRDPKFAAELVALHETITRVEAQEVLDAAAEGRQPRTYAEIQAKKKNQEIFRIVLCYVLTLVFIGLGLVVIAAPLAVVGLVLNARFFKRQIFD